jgi:hypothetical protein
MFGYSRERRRMRESKADQEERRRMRENKERER